MEVRLLRYLLAVAREGSITRAAAALHITQPTLSRQIAQLERELGVELFIRDGKRMELTDKGLLLRRRAEEIIELVDKAERELTEVDRALEGVVAVGCGDLRAVGRLAELMRDFAAEHPQVSFDVYTATADHIADRMDRGLTDVALLLEPADVATYEFVPMNVTERWVVVMPPDDPLAARAEVAPADLAGLPVLLPRRAGIKSVAENWFEAAGVEPRVVATGNLNNASAVMAAAGLAYAVVVEGTLASWDERQLVCRPLAHAPRVSSVVAWRRDRPLSRATRRFIAYLRAHL